MIGPADAGAPLPLATGERLSLPRRLGFAVGDFGLNLYWQSITYFLLFFYTDVLGLSAATAGLIYMAASIFDGCIDPVAGAIMERTRSRYGRYRPWIVAGALPLAGSFMLIYLVPDLSGRALIAFVTIGHLLFRFSYTLVAVPFASLTARITTDTRERTSISGLRMLFATAAASIVALGTQPLAATLGRSQATGFFWVAALIGMVSTLVFLVVVLSTAEPAAADLADVDRDVAALSLSDRLTALLGNRAFLALIVGLLFAALSSTVISKSLLYYFKYVVADQASSRYALTISTFSGFVLVPLWAFVARRAGKRRLWLIGVVIGLCGLTFMAIVRPAQPFGATTFFVAMQVSVVAIAVSYWAMLPDTVEFGEWRTGVRLESFLFGLFMFFQKMGLGLAAGLFGWALAASGYTHDMVDTGVMRETLPLIILLLSGGGLVCSGATILISPLKLGVHEQITADLAARRAAGEE